MTSRKPLTLLLALTLLPAAAHAQDHNPERGLWHASSKSAKTITGDVVFTDLKFTLDFFSYPLANIRPLTSPEIAAAFDADAASNTSTGTLYRLSIPSSKTFLRGHPLCSGEETQWIVTHLSGKSLEILFFSGPAMPVLTPDALTNSPSLCGLFTYSR
jgi:hypothetical protein